jgi:folate-binding protein YgfZ
MNVEQEVLSARRLAGARLAPEVRTLEVGGPDRERYLNGMLSSDLTLLEPGMGQLAIKPSPKGRVEGVVRVRAVFGAYRLDLDAAEVGLVAAQLERFIIMDDCAVADVSASREVVEVLGPEARAVVRRAGLADVPDDLPDLWSVRAEGLTAIRDDRLGLSGVELHVPPGEGAGVLARLLAAGATPLGDEAREVLRVEAGVPRAGRELDEDTLPMEARLERALDFQKGCYVGQEVIARATNLGGIKHILVGLELQGEPDALLGAALWPEAGDKVTGEITSAVRSPTLDGKTIGLGFVRKVHEAPGTVLEARMRDGRTASARVTALPFMGP